MNVMNDRSPKIYKVGAIFFILILPLYTTTVGFELVKI